MLISTEPHTPVDGALTATVTSTGEGDNLSGGGATTVLTKADATQFNTGVNLAASTSDY